jgi:hypothetical protein
MITVIKVVAAAALAVSILSPGFAPRADNCECKAKAGAAVDHLKFTPRVDNCECKAKAN